MLQINQSKIADFTSITKNYTFWSATGSCERSLNGQTLQIYSRTLSDIWSRISAPLVAGVRILLYYLYVPLAMWWLQAGWLVTLLPSSSLHSQLLRWSALNSTLESVFLVLFWFLGIFCCCFHVPCFRCLGIAWSRYCACASIGGPRDGELLQSSNDLRLGEKKKLRNDMVTTRQW